MLLVNYLRGIKRFRIIGLSPERFINIANRRELPVFGIHCDDSSVCGCISSVRFNELADAAKKSAVQLEIIEEYGLPFKIKKHRQRIGFFIGFGLFCFILWYLSLFVWSVKTVGLPGEYQVSVSDTLYNEGIRTGALCSSIDGTVLKNVLEHELNDFDLVTVSRMGCYAEVHFTPSKSVRINVNDGKPCDRIASDGGEIVEIVAEKGTPMVMPGDVVYPGDVLISGLFEGDTGNISMVHSAGKVTALVENTFTEAVSFRQTVKQPTGRTVIVNHVYAFGMELPLLLHAPKGNYNISSQTINAQFLGVRLPFSLRREYCKELCFAESTLSEKECIAQAEKSIEQRIKKQDVGEIVSSDQTVNPINGGIRITRYVTSIKDISIEREILFSQNNTSSDNAEKVE